jgi:hypothetical protein
MLSRTPGVYFFGLFSFFSPSTPVYEDGAFQLLPDFIIQRHHSIFLGFLRLNDLAISNYHLASTKEEKLSWRFRNFVP